MVRFSSLIYWYVAAITSGIFFVNSHSDFKNVFERREIEEYRECVANFEIHQDKIIRTEESKRMGAKYLNEKDVTSKDECVQFCCKTPNCNVFVLEEKVFNRLQGTCYLFECGTPDNFKCKFTRHHNYSSAALIINRAQLQLEDEIQYIQHERELTSLRNSVTNNGNDNGTKSDKWDATAVKKTSPTFVDESNYYIEDAKEPTVKHAVRDATENGFRKSGKCSRFQFECRSSGECIAIYNACDGIPQCSDHSDEDAQLGCPTNVITKTIMKENRPNDKQYEFASGNEIYNANANVDEANNYNSANLMIPIVTPMTDAKSFRVMSSNKVRINGEDDRMGRTFPSDRNVIPAMDQAHYKISSSQQQLPVRQQYPDTWQSRVHQNYGPSYNFNHKQNEMTNVRYNNYGEYAGGAQMDYNVPYDRGYDVVPPSSQQQRIPYYSNRYNANPIIDPWHGSPNGQSLDTKSSGTFENRKFSPEYYSEENNASRTGSRQTARVPFTQQQVPFSERQNNTATIAEPTDRLLRISTTDYQLKSTSTTALNVKPIVTYNTTSQTTADPVAGNVISRKEIIDSGSKPSDQLSIERQIINKDVESEETSNIKKEDNHENIHPKSNGRQQIFSAIPATAEREAQANSLARIENDSENDGYTEEPSGAIVSLTLGLFVTFIMVFVIVYRLKIVRKRIRRGGKLPYAHDADFLVNGMYL